MSRNCTSCGCRGGENGDFSNGSTNCTLGHPFQQLFSSLAQPPPFIERSINLSAYIVKVSPRQSVGTTSHTTGFKKVDDARRGKNFLVGRYRRSTVAASDRRPPDATISSKPVKQLIAASSNIVACETLVLVTIHSEKDLCECLTLLELHRITDRLEKWRDGEGWQQETLMAGPSSGSRRFAGPLLHPPWVGVPAAWPGFGNKHISHILFFDSLPPSA